MLGSRAKGKGLRWWVCRPISSEADGAVTVNWAQLWKDPQPGDNSLPSLPSAVETYPHPELDPRTGRKGRQGQDEAGLAEPRAANRDKDVGAGLDVARGVAGGPSHFISFDLPAGIRL